MKILCSFLLVFLISFIECHSVNNKQLLWVEPISTVKLDVAARSEQFFTKRDISANSHYQPNVRSLQYDDSLRLTVNAFNKTIFLHLTPNHDLFHPNAVFHMDGVSTKLNPVDFRVYRGFVIDDIYSEHWWLSGLLEDASEMENQPGVLGWARITVRNDIRHDLDHPLFEGVFSIYGDTHHVKLKDNYHLTKRSDDAELISNFDSRMVIYRDSDTAQNENALAPLHGGGGGGECGFDRMSHIKKQSYDPVAMIDHSPFALKSNFQFGKTLNKRAPAGCPTTKKVLYMGAAADCTYVKHYQSADNARRQIINDWNSVSSVYSSTFNVAIGLINITLMDSTCPTTPVSSTNWNQACSTSYPISGRLSDFSVWRGKLGDDGAGLWHLMTDCASGSDVGIAWLSQVCNTEAKQGGSGEFTSGTGVSSIIRDEWKVVAHEIGHNFGANHDCNAQSCSSGVSKSDCCPLSSTECDAGGKYFMNPTSNASSDAFSPCSIKKICDTMPEFLNCLDDPGTRKETTLKMCGNGIKEEGEDCDTGGQPSNCCDPATCKFKAGAICDDFNDLCCNNCQLRPANYTCRPASTECDIAEVCSGTTGDCPVDKFKDDLTDCGQGLKCASGQCTSRDAQCAKRAIVENLTKACSSENGCAIVCQNPRSVISCMQFPGYFTDGTPCGIGGVCKQGHCNTSNFGNNIKSWIDSHLQIFIPVVVVAGLLLFCCLWRCCFHTSRSGYNNIGKTTAYVIPAQQHPYPAQYNNAQSHYPPPPPGQQPYYTPPPQGWVDPALYNGNGGPYGPQQPLPVYSQTDPNQRTDAYELNNANNWNSNANRGPGSPAVSHASAVPHSPNPPNQQQHMPSPSPAPMLPPHTNNNGQQRPYNEGII